MIYHMYHLKAKQACQRARKIGVNFKQIVFDQKMKFHQSKQKKLKKIIVAGGEDK